MSNAGAPVSSTSQPPSSPTTTAVDTSPERPTSPAETIRPAKADDTSPASSPPPRSTAERAFQYGLERNNLEQEVGQVLGTLNSWWGGVKKQSASALSTLKADLDKTMVQAQADFEHLRTAKIEVVAKDAATREAEQAEQIDLKGKGKERAQLDESASASGSFLDRITSSTNQLQTQLQSTIQATLASAAANPALHNSAQLRAQLVEKIRLSSARHNLELSVKQAEKLAEEYMRKGDQWVREGQKWMEDAVKVVPPESGEVVGMTWDGSDFYSFSTSRPNAPKADDGNKTPRASFGGAALAGSRKEALLRRLREDKDLLLVDPEGAGETEERRKEFGDWVARSWEEEQKEGKEQEQGHVGAIRMALVPESLSDEQFWKRYLFHKHMIEAEEERRKRLLAATETTQADDFSWDDEPEEAPSSSSPGNAQEVENATPTVKSPDKLEKPPIMAAKASTSTSTSPRDSEESYDLVSDQGGPRPKAAAPADADEDSDWE